MLGKIALWALGKAVNYVRTHPELIPDIDLPVVSGIWDLSEWLKERWTA